MMQVIIHKIIIISIINLALHPLYVNAIHILSYINPIIIPITGH